MNTLINGDPLDTFNAYAEQIQLIGKKEISRIYLNPYFYVDSIEPIADDEKEDYVTMLFQVNCRYGNRTDNNEILFNVSRTLDIPVDKVNNYDYISGMIYHMIYVEEFDDER